MPWIAAVAVAPLLFGAVNSAVQAVLALAIAGSLVFTCMHLRVWPATRTAQIAVGTLAVLFLFQVIPLPPRVIDLLNPEAGRLAVRFDLTTLSLSPADTVLRVWQILLLVAVFLLARQASGVRHLAGMLGATVALSLIVLAATELWFLIDGKGVWNEAKHYPAGTFANRNHFANWMAMGAMMVFGGLLRTLRHFRTAPTRNNAALAALFAVALAASVASVVACGSRGGMLALGSGLTFWVLTLIRQKRRSTALAVLGVAVAGAIGAFAVSGELFMQRITQDALSFKWRLWEDALAMFSRSPVFGIGLGAFEPAFGMNKTFHGEGTFLFAENDYLQWLIETGLVGTACVVVLVISAGRVICRRVEQYHFSRSEYFYGALAALTAFAVHGIFEFVSHVMANALLAAGLLGLALGLKECASGPRVAPPPSRRHILTGIGLALIIGGLAVPQLVAQVCWDRAEAEVVAGSRERVRQEAFGTWPLDRDRGIELTRAIIKAGESGTADHARAHVTALRAVDQALRWRPLDWRLRLERAWLLLAVDPRAALPEIFDVIALNPLQPQIPLRFGAALASVYPPAVIEVLKAGRYRDPAHTLKALELTWAVDAARVWEVTPATDSGLVALEKFAKEKGLIGLADEAAKRRDGLGRRNGH